LINEEVIGIIRINEGVEEVETEVEEAETEVEEEEEKEMYKVAVIINKGTKIEIEVLEGKKIVFIHLNNQIINIFFNYLGLHQEEYRKDKDLMIIESLTELVVEGNRLKEVKKVRVVLVVIPELKEEEDFEEDSLDEVEEEIAMVVEEVEVVDEEVEVVDEVVDEEEALVSFQKIKLKLVKYLTKNSPILYKNKVDQLTHINNIILKN